MPVPSIALSDIATVSSNQRMHHGARLTHGSTTGITSRIHPTAR